MAKQVSGLIGVVERINNNTNRMSAASNLVDLYKYNKDGFYLTNQYAQAGAAITGLSNITRASSGFIPMINMHTNIFAATTSLLKITLDVNNNQGISRGDVVTLMSNTAGIIGSIYFLSTASAPGLVFTGALILVNTASLYHSNSAEDLGRIYSRSADYLNREFLDPLWNRYFKTNPDANFEGCWVAPDLTLASDSEIENTYGSTIAACEWSLSDGSMKKRSVPINMATKKIGGPHIIAPGPGHGFQPPEAWEIFPDDPYGWVNVGDPMRPGDDEDQYDCCATNKDSYY